MFFGPLSPSDPRAEGAVLAHSLRTGGIALPKGHVLSRAELDRLAAAGVTELVVARRTPGEIDEDGAAAQLAAAVAGPGVRIGPAATGRVNLFAAADGVVQVDTARLDRLNHTTEAITLGTRAPFTAVTAGQMIATVKIIPFAVPEPALLAAIAAAGPGGAPPLLALAPFRPHAAGLIQTRLPGTRESVLDKTAALTRRRLSAVGGRLGTEDRCDHTPAALADTIARQAAAGFAPLLIVGASAITDRRDVLPTALARAGGETCHLGMPVDPGNLVLLGRLGPAPVLGLPGCARSPKLNGFDWLLQRLAAGLSVTGTEIMAMGAGGLLIDAGIPPALAALDHGARPVAAVVLAAGRSARMGETNKLVLPIEGVPMVRRVVAAAAASAARPVIVVTGDDAAAVAGAVAGFDVTLAHNPAYADGLAGSLATGIAAVPETCAGALICLGDMPWVPTGCLDRLIDAFGVAETPRVCWPTVGGVRGNPVLWPRDRFADLKTLTGDRGARALADRLADQALAVAVDTTGILRDVDTPADYAGPA